jgi:hypothetical protein
MIQNITFILFGVLFILKHFTLMQLSKNKNNKGLSLLKSLFTSHKPSFWFPRMEGRSIEVKKIILINRYLSIGSIFALICYFITLVYIDIIS